MSGSESSDGKAVDRLIADHLDRQAQQSDASALLTRIRMSRQVDDAISMAMLESTARPRPARALSGESAGSKGASTRWSRSLVWGVFTGLALLIAFLGGLQFGPLTANAATMLRDLQGVHRSDIDRCYRVQYAPDPLYWDGSNRLEGPSQSLLWTRGDRFWSDCSIGDLRLIIGREEDGSLWIRPSPDKGIRFSNDESQLPREVSLICAVNAMTVPRLVDDVLAGFELRVDSTAKRSDEPRTLVWASLKPGHSHPVISSALLEIDPDTQSLMRLVLWMIRDGQPKGTVTYTFVERAVQDDGQYELRSHLNDDATIEDHTFETVQD